MLIIIKKATYIVKALKGKELMNLKLKILRPMK